METNTGLNINKRAAINAILYLLHTKYTIVNPITGMLEPRKIANPLPAISSEKPVAARDFIIKTGSGGTGVPTSIASAYDPVFFHVSAMFRYCAESLNKTGSSIIFNNLIKSEAKKRTIHIRSILFICFLPLLYSIGVDSFFMMNNCDGLFLDL